MKAREVVGLLQKLIELHGDLNVSISIYDTEYDFDRCADACEVDYDPEYKEFCIH